MSQNDSTPKSTAINLSQVSLLLVDDQKAARQLLRAYLVRIGIGRIEEATDSIEALRILMLTSKGQSPFKAVFVSRAMREMSGLDLVKNIRLLAGWDDFPIVVISEDLDFVHVRESVQAGASEYLIRPYDEATLRSMLERLLVK